MNVSVIVTCGYLFQEDPEKNRIETQRLRAFIHCLYNLSKITFGTKNEIVISEFGITSRLAKIAQDILKNIQYKYVFTQGDGFNQSLAKNAGAEIARNEILLFINSDVLLEQNVFDILIEAFKKNSNIFATAARHDLFIDLDHFLDVVPISVELHRPENYFLYNTYLDDAGWHHALRRPKEKIPTTIKVFGRQNGAYKVVHDFQNGYVNYGEFMAVTRDIWKKYRFDPEVNVVVDSYFRDIIFFYEPLFKLEFVHDRTSVFHLSGSDYMNQESGGHKYNILIKDLRTAIDKYEWARHWAVLSYFPEFDDLIEKHSIPFKQIFDEYCTDFIRKYYRYRDLAKEKYGIEI